MLRNGSPAGANVTDPALPPGVEHHDHSRHPAASGPQAEQIGEAQTWKWEDKRRGLVRVLTPAPTTGGEPDPAPTPEREKTATTTKPSGKVPLKFAFREAMRGRIGDGDQQITRPEYVALGMLETYADADLTSARPGHARLADDLGYAGTDPQRVVRRLLASLSRKGYLVITHHGTNVVGNVATEYRLTLPEWEA